MSLFNKIRYLCVFYSTPKVKQSWGNFYHVPSFTHLTRFIIIMKLFRVVACVTRGLTAPALSIVITSLDGRDATDATTGLVMLFNFHVVYLLNFFSTRKYNMKPACYQKVG